MQTCITATGYSIEEARAESLFGEHRSSLECAIIRGIRDSCTIFQKICQQSGNNRTKIEEKIILKETL